MNKKSITIMTLMALLTTVTLAGSIWLSLYLAGDNSINPLRILPADNYALAAIAAFSSYFSGGGL